MTTPSPPDDSGQTRALRPGDRLVATSVRTPDGAGSLTLGELMNKLGTIDESGIRRGFEWPILLQLYELGGAGPPVFETAAFQPDTLTRREVRDLIATRVLPIQKRPGTAFDDMITLGRAPNCDLVIPVPAVSKFHLWFQYDELSWFIVDAGSTNGTAVDGETLEARRRHRLEEPAVISVSGEFHYRFVPPAALYHLLSAADRLR